MRAVIVGHTGQDGTYAKELLLKLEYQVIGVSSNRTDAYNCTYKLQTAITDSASVEKLICEFKPDEVYFFAAVHHSSADRKMEDNELFYKSFEVNTLALINFLTAIKKYHPEAKLFYAASSHIFGSTTSEQQNEDTPIKPNCIYGITKTAGVNACHFFRNCHGLHASVGIFYNHESPLRAEKYVSTKIVRTAVAIKNGKANSLTLGDLDARIDWGFAPDYVLAVYKILQLDNADDFIISSGEQHTIRDFAAICFSYLNLKWEDYVKVDANIITKMQKRSLFGDNTKIKKLTGWHPSLDFEQLVKTLVDAEIKRVVDTMEQS